MDKTRRKTKSARSLGKRQKPIKTISQDFLRITAYGLAIWALGYIMQFTNASVFINSFKMMEVTGMTLATGAFVGAILATFIERTFNAKRK